MAKFFRRKSKKEKDVLKEDEDPEFRSTKEKDAYRKLQHRLSEMQFKREELSVLVTKYQNENNRMLWKSSAHDKLLVENKKLKADIDKLKSELQTKGKQASSSSAEAEKQLSDKTAEIAKLSKETEEMKEINEALVKKMAKVQHQNIQLKATAAELAQKANDAVERVNELREKSQKVEQEALGKEQELVAKVEDIKQQRLALKVELSQTLEREKGLLLKLKEIQEQNQKAEAASSETLNREKELMQEIKDMQLQLTEAAQSEEALKVKLANSEEQGEELEKTLAELLERSQHDAQVAKEKEQAIQAMLDEKEKKNQELELELAAEYSRSSDLEAAEELKIQMAAVQEKNCQLRLEKKQLIRNAEETSATLEEMKEKDNEIKAAEVRKFKELYEMTKFSLIERIKLQKQEIDTLRKWQRQFNLSKVNLEVDQMSADLLKSELKTSRELVVKLERELLQAKKHDLRQPKLVQDPRMAKKFSVLEQENKQLHRRIKNLTQTVTNEVREKTAHRRDIAMIKWRVAFQKLQKMSKSKVVEEGCNLIKSYFIEYTDKEVQKTFIIIIEFIKEEHQRSTIKRSPRQREQRYRTSQAQESEKPSVLAGGGRRDSKMNLYQNEVKT